MKTPARRRAFCSTAATASGGTRPTGTSLSALATQTANQIETLRLNYAAVIGLWVGSLAFAPQWSALALAVGAGAILQVVVEVTMLLRRGGAPSGALFSPAAVAGLACGVGVMYLTAMLVKI